MKIDVTGKVGLYGTAPGAASKAQAQRSAGDFKTEFDKAEFARGSSTVADKELVTLKAGIQRDVSADIGAARLELLRESVRDQSYYVSSEELARSIMEIDA